MKRTKYMAMALCLSMTVFLLSGCSSSAESTSTSSSSTSEVSSQSTNEAPDDTNFAADINADAVYGEVVSVEDGIITINVGTLKDGTSDSEDVASDSMLDFTGETMEITVTDDTLILGSSMGSMGGRQMNDMGDMQMSEDGDAPEMPDGEDIEFDEDNMPDDTVNPGSASGDEAMNRGEIDEENAPADAGDFADMADESEIPEDMEELGEMGEMDNPQNAESTMTIDDISKGDIICITLDDDGNAASIMVMTMNLDMGDMQIPEDGNLPDDMGDTSDLEAAEDAT